MLFPSAPAPSTPSTDSRVSLPSTTTHKPSALEPFLVQSQLKHRPRRHSSLSLQQQHQFAGSSPAQVTRLFPPQSTGFPLSTSASSSSLSRSRYRDTASVPFNSPLSYRPPVPFFNGSRSSSSSSWSYLHRKQQQFQNYQRRRLMSHPDLADMSDLFDLPSHPFGDELESTMLSPQQYSTPGLMPTPDSMAGAPSGTISPKDLMMDASAPPSACLTDLSTPSFESPGYFSQDPSPMFPTDMEFPPGHEEWDPLFPTNDNDAFSAAFDSTSLEVAAAMPPPKARAHQSPMVREASVSSPAPSPAPSRGSTKPSTVAGVNARQRKPLPVIQYDSSDPVALKRARNTEAARKSRARKMQRADLMEQRIADLEKSLEESQKREQYWKALAQNKS